MNTNIDLKQIDAKTLDALKPEGLSNLETLKAYDIMMPRADIIAIDKDDSAKEVLEILKTHKHTSYPYFKHSLDEVLGIVNAHDLLISLVHNKKSKITKSLIKPCLFVSPTMPVLDLLLQMQKEKIKIALVVDEFGGVDGLISIIDVLEKIVIKLKGAYDNEDYDVKTLKNGDIKVDARIPLDILSQEIGLKFAKDMDVDTLGGFVVISLGRLPATGEIVKLDNGMICEIVQADSRKVEMVKILNKKKK